MGDMYFTIYKDTIIWFGTKEECEMDASEYEGARVVSLNSKIINIEYLISDLKKLKGGTKNEVL